MSFSSLLIHSVDVQSLTETKSAAGFASKSWMTTATGVPCRVQSLNAEAVIAYGRLGLPVSDRVFFASDQSLSVGSRLVFADAELEVKQVQAFYALDGTTPHHWEALVERKALGGN